MPFLLTTSPENPIRPERIPHSVFGRHFKVLGGRLVVGWWTGCGLSQHGTALGETEFVMEAERILRVHDGVDHRRDQFDSTMPFRSKMPPAPFSESRLHLEIFGNLSTNLLNLLDGSFSDVGYCRVPQFFLG